MSLAVHRHRLAAVREHHPAALPGAAREEILAQVVRGELVEKRVDPRAVVALGVVLGHDLPVRRDVVLQPGCAPEPAEVPLEARVVPEPVVQVGLQPGRRGVEAEEDPAAPDLRPDRGESRGRETEVLEVLGVPGPDEPPVQVVDPGVVWALETDRRPAFTLLYRRATMAAHVVEGANDVVTAADQQDALAEVIAQDEASRIRDLFRPRHRDPVPEEPLLALELQERVVVVGPAGKEPSATERPADRGKLLRRQRRGATRRPGGGHAAAVTVMRAISSGRARIVADDGHRGQSADAPDPEPALSRA